jgi:hypothetical protein
MVLLKLVEYKAADATLLLLEDVVEEVHQLELVD